MSDGVLDALQTSPGLSLLCLWIGMLYPFHDSGGSTDYDAIRAAVVDQHAARRRLRDFNRLPLLRMRPGAVGRLTTAIRLDRDGRYKDRRSL